MTLVDVNRLFAYWRARPAANDLINIIAQMIGWKPRVEIEEEPVSFEKARAETAEWFAAPERWFRK